MVFLMRSSFSWQAAADAKYYGNVEVYNILKARGAKIPVHINLYPDFIESF